MGSPTYAKSASYLYNKGNASLFRLAVPVDIRIYLGRSEIRCRLGQLHLREARSRAMGLASSFKRMFGTIRKAVTTMTDQQIQNLARKLFKDILEADQHERVMSGPLRPSQIYEDQMQNAIKREEYAQDQSVKDIKRVSPIIESFIDRNGIDLEKDSSDYRRLCFEVLRVMPEYYELRDLYAGTGYSIDDDFLQHVFPKCSSESDPALLPSPDPAPSADTPPPDPLSTVVQSYISENEQAKKWTAKTQEEITAILKLFMDMVGDLPISSLNHKIMREYKDTLRRLPANRAKDPRYRNKGVSEILEMKDVEPMSVRSINKHLEKTASFLKWSVKQGYIPVNYGEGMSLPVSTRAQEERSPFDTGDLKKLFHSPRYIMDTFKHSYQFWVPLIGLFSGCRIEEICQLHLEDIRQEDGVWVFDINDSKDKKVKTIHSKRLVPIHPFLSDDLGLIRHVERLKEAKATRLFPELPKRRDGYSQDASRWFGRYKLSCGVHDPKKVFHSFRHTLIDHLKQKRIEYVMLAELIGHEVQGETNGRYAKRYSPAIAREEAVLMLDFGIDLSHLKQSRYCGHNFKG